MRLDESSERGEDHSSVMISIVISVGKGGGRRRMRRLRMLEGGLLCKNSSLAARGLSCAADTVR
jgi:hypothetical protein